MTNVFPGKIDKFSSKASPSFNSFKIRNELDAKWVDCRLSENLIKIAQKITEKKRKGWKAKLF